MEVKELREIAKSLTDLWTTAQDIDEVMEECRTIAERMIIASNEQEELEFNQLMLSDKTKYRHYKGGIYTMLCDATLEWCPENSESHVIVYEGEDGRRWVRPRHQFFGTTIDDERRFKKIEEV